MAKNAANTEHFKLSVALVRRHPTHQAASFRGGTLAIGFVYKRVMESRVIATLLKTDMLGHESVEHYL